MSFRSPVGRAWGLGSAKYGFEQWWGQRLSAVGLALLGSWFVISLLGLDLGDHAAVSAWIASLPHAILLTLLACALFYHSNLGVTVVLQDYIHGRGALAFWLALTRIIHAVMAVAAVFSIVKLSLGVQA